MDNSNGQFDGPPVASTARIDEVRKCIPLFLQLTEQAVAATVLGYAAASPFTPRLIEHVGRLPFVYVAGERESGKTSCSEMVLELVTGRRDRTTSAINLSPYQYDAAFANANNMLAILDEYRPGTVDDAQIRKHHDLQTKRRGTGVAGTDDIYHLNAPMIVLGEGFADDAATLSRGVLVFFKKSARSSQALFNEACDAPWWAYARHLHTLAQRLSEAEHLYRLNQARAHIDEAAPHINPRLRHAFTFVTYGLLTLQADVDDTVFSSALIESVIRCGVETTLNGGAESATNIEMFLEQLGPVVAELKRHESVISPALAPSQIIIRMSPAVHVVRDRLKDRAAISNTRMLKRLALEAGFFEPGETHRDINNNTVRGLRLDLNRVPERCDVEALVFLNHHLRSNVTDYARAA